MGVADSGLKMTIAGSYNDNNDLSLLQGCQVKK